MKESTEKSKEYLEFVKKKKEKDKQLKKELDKFAKGETKTLIINE